MVLGFTKADRSHSLASLDNRNFFLFASDVLYQKRDGLIDVNTEEKNQRNTFESKHSRLNLNLRCSSHIADFIY